MSGIELYLEPVKDAQTLSESGGDSSFAQFAQVHTEGSFPELKGTGIAFIGIREGRGTHENEGCALAADAVRKALYPLMFHHEQLRLYDLGDVMPGHSLEDSLFAIREVAVYLIERSIVPVFIGGPDLCSLAIYQAYCQLERMCNVVSVDPCLDVGSIEEPLNSDNHIAKAIVHKPGFLFNLCNIGYQRYLVNPDMEATIRRMFFDMHRLGQVNADIMAMEPLVRHGDVLTVDTRVVRRSDAPGHAHALPNGLYGEQLCQLLSFAGLNERLGAVGIFEFNPSYDERGQTAQLVAQAVWCLIDGYAHRRKENVYVDDSHFTRFRVAVKGGHELVFYKSTLTDRWWLEVPYPSGGGNRYQRAHLVPCAYEDYLMACEEEVPDKWWQTYQKLA